MDRRIDNKTRAWVAELEQEIAKIDDQIQTLVENNSVIGMHELLMLKSLIQGSIIKSLKASRINKVKRKAA